MTAYMFLVDIVSDVQRLAVGNALGSDKSLCLVLARPDGIHRRQVEFVLLTVVLNRVN